MQLQISCNYGIMSNKFLEAVVVGFLARVEGGKRERFRSREGSYAEILAH